MPKGKEPRPERVLQDWEVFLRSGLDEAYFTPALHYHLINNTNGGIGGVGALQQYYRQNFTKSYGITTFFAWFQEPNSRILTDWYNSEHAELNRKLCAVYQKYKKEIERIAAEKHRKDTLLGVKGCLAKYGLSLQLLKEWAQIHNQPLETAQQVVDTFFSFKKDLGVEQVLDIN